ncbi:MAG: hypothetical protein HQK62_14205 [Desulfamplus sp.]|nr:hypothetical protein [Desulfamplus sp.]
MQIVKPDIASTFDIIFRYEPLPDDVEQVKEIVKSTGFFNDEEIEVAGELVQERIDKGDKSGYYFSYGCRTNYNLAPFDCSRMGLRAC